MNALHHFLNMGGYGFYVWTAYGTVFFALTFTWLRMMRHVKKT